MITVHPNSRIQETDQEYSVVQFGWMDSANCRSVLPDDFHPNTSEPAATNKAKKVCAGCDVIVECGAWAEANPTLTRDGIYGGMSPRQRQRRRAAASPQ